MELTHSTRSLWTRVLPPILFLVFTLDVAQHGISIIVVFFLENLGLNSLMATTISEDVFGCLAHLTPLAGGYLADAYFGRYGTIQRGLVLHGIGFTLIWISTWCASKELALALFCVGLFGGNVFGGGCTRPTISPFGLDQFTLPAQSDSKDMFLSLYYIVSAVAGVAVIPLNPLGLYGMPPLVPVEDRFVAAFSVPLLAFSLGCVVFVCCFTGTRLPAQGNRLGELLRQVASVTRNGEKRGRWLGYAGWLALVALFITNIAVFIPGDRQVVAVVGLLVIVLLLSLLRYVGGGSVAWVGHSHRDLDPLVKVLGLLPFFVIYYCGSYVTRTTFGLQACQMDQLEGLIGYKLPPGVFFHYSWLNLPVAFGFIMLRSTGCFAPSMLQLMRVAVSTITLAFVFGALVEQKRKSVSLYYDDNNDEYGISSCPPVNDEEEVRVRKLSLLWFLPQILCVSIAKYCFSIGSIEFFYTQVPASMRSIGASLQLLTLSFGALLSTTFNLLVLPWVPNNLDHGHMERVYWIMAIMMAINSIGFLRESNRYPLLLPMKEEDASVDVEGTEDTALSTEIV